MRNLENITAIELQSHIKVNGSLASLGACPPKTEDNENYTIGNEPRDNYTFDSEKWMEQIEY